MIAQQLTEDITSASSSPKVSRESATSVTIDVDDLEALNLEMSEVIERTRVPVGRSASFDVRKINGPQTTTMGSSRRGAPKRTVSFGKVQVRNFERVLTDHPPTCCPGGPSLGLGWNYTEKKAVDVDKFESKGRYPFGFGRRNKDMLMSAEKREKVAKKLGFSQDEIQTNAKKNAKVNRQREKTVTAIMEKEMEAYYIMEQAREATREL